MSKADLLLVEDEQIAAMDIREMIEQSDYNVTSVVDSAEDAIKEVEDVPVDLVIMDIRLSGERDGIDAVREMNENQQIPVVYLTAHSDDETLQRAKDTNPAGFLVKPVTEADLRTTIEMVLEQ
jgi:CheY-like chemotaxis protein